MMINNLLDIGYISEAKARYLHLIKHEITKDYICYIKASNNLRLYIYVSRYSRRVLQIKNSKKRDID